MEWKELKIDNLPPDILTGDYEWEVWEYNRGWESSLYDETVDILQPCLDGVKYRYRKRIKDDFQPLRDIYKKAIKDMHNYIESMEVI